MKRLLILLISAAMICLLAASVCAAEGDTQPLAEDVPAETAPAEEVPAEEPTEDKIYNVKLLVNDPSVVDLRDQSDPAPLVGLKSIIRDIFGEYAPVKTSTVLEDTSTNTRYIVDSVASGAAGVDYEYIAAVLLFAVVLWSLFRIVGGLIK